jgi:hypothetical protein
MLSDKDRRVRLLVSSKVLSLVSHIFAAMFASWFKEGLSSNNPSSSEKPVIALPEDDAEALTLLCKLAHYQTRRVSKCPNTACLKKFAIVCDKYDCVGVFTHTSTMWLKARLHVSDAEEHTSILFVAYVFDLPDAFSAVLWPMLLAKGGSIYGRPSLSSSDLVRHDLLGTCVSFCKAALSKHNSLLYAAPFKARRAEVIYRVAKVFENSISRPLAGCTECSTIAVSYLIELRSCDLLPSTQALERMSIAHFLDVKLSVKEPAKQHCRNCYCSYGSGDPLCFRAELRYGPEHILGRDVGLCLDCIKTGRKSFDYKECRV